MIERRQLLLGATALGAAALAAAPSGGWAQGSVLDPTAAEQEAYVRALRTPGHALLLRHTLAPGHGDPADFDVSNCSTQRNLSAEGRAQAVKVGAWLKARGVRPAQVHSSPWCRCLETARLMDLAPVVVEPGLRSFAQQLSPKGKTMAALRRFIAESAGNADPMILVGHSSTFAELLGGLLGSGEGMVVRLREDGQVDRVGRVLFGMERVG